MDAVRLCWAFARGLPMSIAAALTAASTKKMRDFIAPSRFSIGISHRCCGLRHSIVTVNVIEEAGAPELSVPVRTAVVFPVGPLPPPHAAKPTRKRTTSTRARAMFGRNSLRRVPASSRSPRTKIITAHSLRGGSGPVPGRRTGFITLFDVVFTVTVTRILVTVDVNVIELGLKLQVASFGRLEHARLTVPVYPSRL